MHLTLFNPQVAFPVGVMPKKHTLGFELILGFLTSWLFGSPARRLGQSPMLCSWMVMPLVSDQTIVSGVSFLTQRTLVYCRNAVEVVHVTLEVFHFGKAFITKRTSYTWNQTTVGYLKVATHTSRRFVV